MVEVRGEEIQRREQWRSVVARRARRGMRWFIRRGDGEAGGIKVEACSRSRGTADVVIRWGRK